MTLTSNELQELQRYAQSLVWRNPRIDLLKPEHYADYSALAHLIQDAITKSHDRKKLVLPDMQAHDNETVAIFSDYAGESSGNFATYSVLIAAYNLLAPFKKQMNEVRNYHDLGSTEIAFKNFRMGQMQRALSGYLRALNDRVPGFLFTVVVDKSLVSLFGKNTKETTKQAAKELDKLGFNNIKPNVAEKTLRVAHTAAFMVALLAKPGQKLFWMTDNDEICPNEDRHQRLLEFFYKSAVPTYTGNETEFGTSGGGVPFPKGDDLGFADLLSATDVVASSIEHYLTRLDDSSQEDVMVKQGSDEVLRWLSHGGAALQKMTIILRPSEGDAIVGATLEFNRTDGTDDMIEIPVIV